MTSLPLRPPENLQAPEKPVYATQDGSTLDVVEVFPTIQGEGPYAGRPAVFVRLAGCNLRCPGCDTNYTAGRAPTDTIHLARKVLELFPYKSTGIVRPLVVLTGGEPLRQPVGPFVRLLNETGFGVQVETNGTIYQEDFPWYGPNVVVCSPKTGTINELLRFHVKDLKYVLRAGAVDEADGLPTSILGQGAPARPWGRFTGTVWVQPEDEGDKEKNEANTEAAVQSAMKYGYRFGVQLHKWIGMP